MYDIDLDALYALEKRAEGGPGVLAAVVLGQELDRHNTRNQRQRQMANQLNAQMPGPLPPLAAGVPTPFGVKHAEYSPLVAAGVRVGALLAAGGRSKLAEAEGFDLSDMEDMGDFEGSSGGVPPAYVPPEPKPMAAPSRAAVAAAAAGTTVGAGVRRAARAAQNYMMQPTPVRKQGRYGYQVPSGVNAQGYTGATW